MNRVQALLNRECGISHNLSYNFLLKRLRVAPDDNWIKDPPDLRLLISAAKFADFNGYRHILAVAYNLGIISLQDTARRSEVKRALCHPRVLDLEWVKQNGFITTAEDHTAKLWEVTESELIKICDFVGHGDMVRTVASCKSDTSLFATGGQDNAIILWDIRTALNLGSNQNAANCIRESHTKLPGMSFKGVSALVFQDEHTLISCCNADGAIKVWDLRRNYSTYRNKSLPRQILPYAGVSPTNRGFSSLAINDAGNQLYANCEDNMIYCYNIWSYAALPLTCYKSAVNGVAKFNICLSPDNQYLLSGGLNDKAHIWNLNYTDEPLLTLCGHKWPVTRVAWGKANDRPIVTCGYDASYKIWRVGPEHISESEQSDQCRDHAEYVIHRSKRKSTYDAIHENNLHALKKCANRRS